MIELLKWAFIFGMSASWCILLLIFWEQGITTWKMGDRLGASLFFLVDIAVILMFTALFIL